MSKPRYKLIKYFPPAGQAAVCGCPMCRTKAGERTQIDGSVAFGVHDGLGGIYLVEERHEQAAT